MNDDIKKNIISGVAKHLGFDENNLTKQQTEIIMRTVFEQSGKVNSNIANVAQDLVINSTLVDYKFPNLNLEGIDKKPLNQNLTEEKLFEQLKSVESKISNIREQSSVQSDSVKKPKND